MLYFCLKHPAIARL